MLFSYNILLSIEMIDTKYVRYCGYCQSLSEYERIYISKRENSNFQNIPCTWSFERWLHSQSLHFVCLSQQYVPS